MIYRFFCVFRGTPMADFATRLRTLREERLLSQSELAARCGLSIDSLQNWEQGRTQPRLAGLIQLAQGLGVPLDALVATNLPKKRPRKRKPM
jgi:transcriptional regulator with XRE-family HTH domain